MQQRQTSSPGSGNLTSPRNVKLSNEFPVGTDSNNHNNNNGMIPSASANFFQRSTSYGGIMNNSIFNNGNPLAEQIFRAKIPLLQVIDEALRKQEFGFQGSNNNNNDDDDENYSSNNNVTDEPGKSIRSGSNNLRPRKAVNSLGNASMRVGASSMRQSPPRVTSSSNIQKPSDQQQKQNQNQSKNNNDNNNNNNSFSDSDKEGDDDDDADGENINNTHTKSNKIHNNHDTNIFNRSRTTSNDLLLSDPTSADYKKRRTIEEQKEIELSKGRTVDHARERARQLHTDRIETMRANLDNSKERSSYAQRWRTFAEKRKLAEFSMTWQTMLMMVVLMRRWDRECRVRAASDRMAQSLIPLLRLRRSRRLNKKIREEIVKNFPVPPLSVEHLETSDLLKKFGRAHLASVLQFGKLQSYPKGYNLVYYGEPGRDCFVVVHGEVDVFVPKSTGKSGQGEEKYELVHKLTQRAPCVSGHLGMVRQSRRNARLTCRTEVIAYVLDHSDFFREKPSEATMADAMLEARRLHELNMPEMYGNFVNADALAKYYCFEKTELSKLHQLSACMRSQIAVPGQYLIRAGQRSSSMFFLVEGQVDICPPADDFESTHELNIANAVHMMDVCQVTISEANKRRAVNKERWAKIDMYHLTRPYGYYPTRDTPEVGDAKEKFSPLNPQLGIMSKDDDKMHNLMVTLTLKGKATEGRTFMIGGPRFILLDEYNMNVVARKMCDLFEISRDDFLKVMMTDPANLFATRGTCLNLMKQYIEKPNEPDVAAAVFCEFPTIKYSQKSLKASHFGRKLAQQVTILPAGTNLVFNNQTKDNQRVIIAIRGDFSRFSRKENMLHQNEDEGGSGGVDGSDSNDNNNNNNNKTRRNLANASGLPNANNNNNNNTSAGGDSRGGLSTSPGRQRSERKVNLLSTLGGSSVGFGFNGENYPSNNNNNSPIPLGKSRHRGALLGGNGGGQSSPIGGKRKTDGTFSINPSTSTVKQQYLMWPPLSQLFFSSQSYSQTVTKRIEGYETTRSEVLKWIYEIIGKDEERQRLFTQAITRQYNGLYLPPFHAKWVDEAIKENFVKWGVVKSVTKNDSGPDSFAATGNNSASGSGAGLVLENSISSMNNNNSAMNSSSSPVMMGGSASPPISLLLPPSSSSNKIILTNSSTTTANSNSTNNNSKNNINDGRTNSRDSRTGQVQSRMSDGATSATTTATTATTTLNQNQNNSKNNKLMNRRESVVIHDHNDIENNNNTLAKLKDNQNNTNNNNAAPPHRTIKEGGKSVSFTMQSDEEKVHRNNNNISATISGVQELHGNDEIDSDKDENDQNHNKDNSSPTSSIGLVLPHLPGGVGRQNNKNNNSTSNTPPNSNKKFPTLFGSTNLENNNNNNQHQQQQQQAVTAAAKPFNTNSYATNSMSYQVAMQRYTMNMDQAIAEKNEKFLHDVEVKKNKKKNTNSNNPSSSSLPLGTKTKNKNKNFVGDDDDDEDEHESENKKKSKIMNGGSHNNNDDNNSFNDDQQNPPSQIGNSDPQAIEDRKFARGGGISDKPMIFFENRQKKRELQLMKKNRSASNNKMIIDSSQHHNQHNQQQQSQSKITTSILTGPIWATASSSSTVINTCSLLNTGGGTLAAAARLAPSSTHRNNTNNQNKSSSSSLSQTVSSPPIASLWALPNSNDIEGNPYSVGKNFAFLGNNNSNNNSGGVVSNNNGGNFFSPTPPAENTCGTKNSTTASGTAAMTSRTSTRGGSNEDEVGRRKKLTQKIAEYESNQQQQKNNNNHPAFAEAKKSVIERTATIAREQQRR